MRFHILIIFLTAILSYSSTSFRLAHMSRIQLRDTNVSPDPLYSFILGIKICADIYE